MTARRKTVSGFTLIELLIVVAIIGIIAAIAIPNLVAAIQRAKQKRTMTDMRGLGLALERYSVDYGGYPNVPPGWPTAIETVADYLKGDPFENAPHLDAWHNAYSWEPSNLDVFYYSNYSLKSWGKDMIEETVPPYSGYTHYFDCDIVYGDGGFLRVPDGIQKT